MPYSTHLLYILPECIGHRLLLTFICLYNTHNGLQLVAAGILFKQLGFISTQYTYAAKPSSKPVEQVVVVLYKAHAGLSALKLTQHLHYRFADAQTLPNTLGNNLMVSVGKHVIADDILTLPVLEEYSGHYPMYFWSPYIPEGILGTWSHMYFWPTLRPISLIRFPCSTCEAMIYECIIKE